jgi:hypothetical protein
MAAIKFGAETITGKDLDAAAGSNKKQNRLGSAAEFGLSFLPLGKIASKTGISGIASKTGISGIASKIGAKILPRTASGVPKIIGSLAGKIGSKFGNFGEFSNSYYETFMNTLDNKGSVRGTTGIFGKGKGIINNLLRADNISSRDALARFGPKIRDAAREEGISIGDYVAKYFGGMNPASQKNAYKPGPLTKISDFIYNLNPFKQRVGIHIGSRTPDKDPYTSILPGINFYGPGDREKGMTYTWLKGSIQDMANRAMGFMGSDGGVPGATKGLDAMAQNFPIIGEEGAQQLVSDFYITKAIGRIFRDQNIVTSGAMKSGSQKVLEVLPGNATKEQLMEALARNRKNAKIKKFPKPKNKKFNGGAIPYFDGGSTYGSESQGIPAILHGGEYVIRKSAVNKYGTNMLQNINQGIYKKAGQYKIGGYVDGINVPSIPKFSTPMANYAKISAPNVSTGTMQSESTHNYNFYVDNFIGETEWFNSMMKDYNMKVVPANQKQAGLESRVIRTYNGINRGM